MIAYHVKRGEMNRALVQVNKRYEDNIIWNRYDVKRSQHHFTLRVADSKKPGHSIGVGNVMGLDWANKRRLPYACWHVHGYFFEALLEINPEAAIKSQTVSGLITAEAGNWEDYGRGSSLYPAMASECCDCGKEEIPEKVKRIRTFRRMIRT